MGWVGRQFKGHLVQSNSPAMSRDIFSWIRLLSAPTNLTMNTFRNGASTTSQGELLQCRLGEPFPLCLAGTLTCLPCFQQGGSASGLVISGWALLLRGVFAQEQIRECPQEQGCVWAVSRQEWGQKLESITYPRSGRIWLCFHCVLGYVFLSYGKAHCSLVQGFMRGNE